MYQCIRHTRHSDRRSVLICASQPIIIIIIIVSIRSLSSPMSKPLLFVALCVLPLIVSATRPLSDPLVVQGRVYCDTCRAGFLTAVSTYIAGARVRVECKSRDSFLLTYSKDALTDHTGTYKIPVNEEHENQICDVVLVHSPQSGCALIVPGADRARAILSTHNGIASNTRNVNSLAFVTEAPVAGCAQILQAFDESD
uniref:Uncharacterized protein n=1 Tax=Kalanchoe fedtschenkoi TaxID=63787 RepID=A0A7N0UK55_KALFE